MTRLRLALLAILIAGCGHLREKTSLRAGDFEERIRLGPLDPSPYEEDPASRGRAIAQFGRRVGNRSEAAAGAELYLDATRVKYALASPGNKRERRRALDDACDFTVDIGRWAEDPQLVIDAATLASNVRRHRKAVRWAAPRVSSLRRYADVREALKVLRRDEKTAAALLELDRYRNPNVPGEDQVLELGAAGLRLLRIALRRAIADDDRERIRAVSTEIHKADRSDPYGALVLATLAEAAAGTLNIDPWLLDDITQFHLFASAVARFRIRIAAQPKSVALRLAYATRLLEGGLVGDAHLALQAARGGSSDLREYAEYVRSRIATELGEPPHRAFWRENRRTAAPSFMLAVAKLDDEGASPRIRDAASLARAHLFGHAGVGVVPVTTSAAAAADPALPSAARGRAEIALSRRTKTSSSWLRSCEERNLAPSECADVLDSFAQFSIGEGVDLAKLEWTLGSRSADDAWLQAAATRASTAELRAARPNLDAIAAQRLKATGAFERLTLRAELADHDLDAARARLKRIGRTLPANEAVLLPLMLADLEASPEASEEILAGRVYLPELVDLPDEPSEPPPETTAQPGSTNVERLSAGVAALRVGHFATAVALLSPMAETMGGRGGMELAARVGLAAHRVGDTATRDRMLARLDELHAGSWMASVIEGEIAAQAKDWTRARSSYEAALLKAPDSSAAYRGLAAAASALSTEDDAARALVAFARPAGDASAPIAAALDSGQIDTATALAITDNLHDPAALLLLGSRASQVEEVQHRVLPWMIEEVQRASSPSEARARAVKAIEYSETLPEPLQWRDETLPLYWLAGRAEAGLALARRSDGASGVYRLGSGDMDVLLLEARRHGELDDATAFAAWKVDGLDGALLEALADAGPGVHLRAVLCQELTATPEADGAAELCELSWRERKDLDAAVSLSYVLLNRDQSPSRDALLEEIFARPEGVPRFTPDVRERTDDVDIPVWHQNYAAWLVESGHVAEAAAPYQQALALGVYLDRETLESPVLTDALAEEARALDAGTERQFAARSARLGFVSLASGDVQQARLYADAVFARALGREDRGRRWAAAGVADAADLVHADRADPILVSVARGPALAALFDDEVDVEQLETIQRRHPTSAVAALALIKAYVRDQQAERGKAIADVLLRAFPDNLSVVGWSLPVLASVGEEDRARKLYAGLHKHPRRESLGAIPIPASITGPRNELPGWARTPKGWGNRIDKIDDATLLRLGPRRRSHTAVAADAFFPAGYPAKEGQPLSAEVDGGASLLVRMRPRAARCKGRDCATSLLNGLVAGGFSLQWTRTVEIPAGTATEALLLGTESAFAVVVVPTGGRVFELLAKVPLERLEDELPAIKLLRLGFAPLDRALPEFRVATLRAAGANLDPSLALRGRLALFRAPLKRGCPLKRVLGDAKWDAARAELVLDAFLVARTAARRRSILSCAKPHSPLARRIAIAALLDEDAAIHRYGKAATAAHPSRVARDVKEVLSGPLSPPVSADDYFTREDQPPRGQLEVLLALPASSAIPLAQRFVASKDPRERALAWIASGFRRELIPPEDARRSLLEAADADVTLIVPSLFGQTHLDAKGRSAVRTRFDAPKKIIDREGADAVSTLAWILARAVDPEDRSRLKKAAARIELANEDQSKRVRKYLNSLADDHARALALAKDPAREKKGSSKDARALEWLRAKRDEAVESKPRSRHALEKDSLATLLPGSSWTYARVAQPGLFATTVSSLASRLKSDDPSETYVIERLVERTMVSSGFASLLTGGGLDLGKPIECASPAGSEAFVCSATLTDRGAALTEFGRRERGSDSGVAIPLRLSTTAGLVPMALSATPALLHALIYSDDDPEEDAQAAENPIVANERLRTEDEIAGYDLDYYAIVQAKRFGVSIDSERYLVIGTRLFVFGGTEVARRVLRASDEPSLADDPEFARLTKDWQAGSALQAVSLGRASFLDEEEVAFEVAVDGTGLSFRYQGVQEDGVRDAALTRNVLPLGATTAIALGFDAFDDDDEDDFELEGNLKPTDVLPPLPLLFGARSFAFGWYPLAGETLWQGWAMVLERGKELDRKAKKLGLKKLKPGATHLHQGLHYATTKRFLLVASKADLVAKALARAGTATPESPGVKWALGEANGPSAASGVRELEAPSHVDDAIMRFVAAGLSLIEQVEFTAEFEPKSKEGAITGSIRLNLRPAGENDDVVDHWLAAKEIRNAGQLPRRLGSAELQDSLEFTIEVPDADRFARATIGDNDRISASIVDPNHVRLTVRALAPSGTRKRLTAKERKRHLGPTTDLPANDARIKKITRTVVGTATSPEDKATKVLEWVNSTLEYEVTPRSLSGTEIVDAGRGDCTEYARLTVTMLRAAGVPASVNDGMAAAGDEIVAHAWVRYHDGKRWVEIDPTWGRMAVTAGHIEMSVLDVLALISLNRFRIVSIKRAH